MAKQPFDLNKYLLNDSFLRWIENKASEEERMQWDRWEKENSAYQSEILEIKSIVQNLKFRIVEEEDVDVQLKRLQQTISSENRTKPRHSLKRLDSTYRFVAKLAAVFLILLCSVVVFKWVNDGIVSTQQEISVLEEMKTTSTGRGQIKMLTLSDGSKITLNANSSLSFPTNSNGDIEVELDGEAFFEIVAKPEGVDRHFRVKMANGSVKVLGTIFNINAYRKETQVFLKEGAIELEFYDETNVLKDAKLMEPGELSTLSPTAEKIVTQPINRDLYTAWTQSTLAFNNATLQQVSKRLEDIYQIEIIFSDERLMQLEISGSLPNNNLEVFINALENLSGQNIELRGDSVFVGE